MFLILFFKVQKETGKVSKEFNRVAEEAKATAGELLAQGNALNSDKNKKERLIQDLKIAKKHLEKLERNAPESKEDKLQNELKALQVLEDKARTATEDAFTSHERLQTELKESQGAVRELKNQKPPKPIGKPR